MSDAAHELFGEAEPGRKGQILEAAAEVFAERGYRGGSMREIASRVGVTEPALYRHFPGKEAIFIALLRTIGGRARSEAFALIDGIDAERLRPELLAAFADRRRAFRRYAPFLRTVFVAVAHHPEFLAEFRDVIVLPMRERLTAKAAELDAALGRPENADATRDARVRAAMALFVGYFASSVALGDEPDEAIADAALRIMGWDEAR